MKIREYFVELSLVILGVLIALVIDNLRENRRDQETIDSLIHIVIEDLNFDTNSLRIQLQEDSTNTTVLQKIKQRLENDSMNDLDSINYLVGVLWSHSAYKSKSVGYSMIINSGLTHLIDVNRFKALTGYYTFTVAQLEETISIDDEYLRTIIIPYLTKYRGTFDRKLKDKDFDRHELMNIVQGRYFTLRQEMTEKKIVIERAEELVEQIKHQSE